MSDQTLATAQRPENPRNGKLLSSLSLSNDALFSLRRGLAILCLVDCLQRATVAELFYSDLGLLPRYRAHLLLLGTSKMSLHLISGWPAIMAALLIVTALTAASVLRGSDHRWHRVALWALMMSAANRNPLSTDSADDLLRLLLFWDIFLPNRAQAGPGQRTLAPATLGYQAQLSIGLLGSALVLGNPTRTEPPIAFGTLGHPPTWLGSTEAMVFGLGALCLWNRSLRRPWLACLAAVLLLRAATLHPAFPLTLGVACIGLWEPTPVSQEKLPIINFAPWSCGLALWVTLVAGWSALAPASNNSFTWPLKTSAEVLGLHQDWSQIYPLPLPVTRAEFLRRDNRKPLLVLGPEQGRRAALFSQRLAGQPRVAASTLDAQAIQSGSGGPVDLWLVQEKVNPDFRLSRTRRTLAASSLRSPR
jgi:hypothetical protein